MSQSASSTYASRLYADAVPMEVFKREQERIVREKIEAERRLVGAQERFDATERAIKQASIWLSI